MTSMAMAHLFSLLGLVGLPACASSNAARVVFEAGRATHPPGEVLMVMSAAETQVLADGRTRETGTFLNEAFEPYRALTEAGYRVVFATPAGRPAALDPESVNSKYWPSEADRDAAQAWWDGHPSLQTPISLEAARRRADSFQALVVPGGQGAMVDLLEDPHLHALIEALGASDRPVGLVCHAPAVLTRMESGGALAGRRLTSVSGLEEWYIETFVMGAEASTRGIGARLEQAGFRHDAAFPGRGHAVRDCSLVTSQNPYSSEAFNHHLLAALADWREGGRCRPVDQL